MVEQNPIRIGLIGCGIHGANLAQAVERTDGLRLVACVDPDEAAARRAALAATDATINTSVDALLHSTEVDALVVATPHHLLAPIALMGVRAGKHVLVEKPMALNEQQGKEVEFAAASNGVCCMAGYSFRFSMGKYVHDVLATGAVGEIQAISGSIGTGPMNRDWMAAPDTGGGPLLYVGCHLIDFVLWFTGDEASSVFAQLQRRTENGTDQTSAIQIRLSGGGIAQLHVTQAAPSFFYDLHIYGRSGSVTLRGRNFLQFEVEVSSTSVAVYREPTVIRPSVRRDNISMMLVPELEEFKASIIEHRPPAITATDGRRVLRILDAIGESGRSGQLVSLDMPVLAAY